MEIFAGVFEERIRLDILSQPLLAGEVSHLAEWFRGTLFGHPYGEGPYPACPISAYEKTCSGPNAVIPPTDYVYRLSNVGSVIRGSNAKPTYRGNVSPDNFERLQAAQRKQHRLWLPLSDFVQGVLPGNRDCTWWTPTQIQPKPILPSAHKLGMPNDWVKVHSLLLRIRRDVALSAFTGKVPTPIDAFDSSIFVAPVVPGADIGVAIDLESHPNFVLGHPETVAKDIPVEMIEVLPILVEANQRETYRVDLVPMLPALLSYYKSL